MNECLHDDDLITGTKDTESAENLAQKAKEILSTAGMVLCKWKTNSDGLQRKLLNKELIKTTEIKSHSTLKILGIAWRTDMDDLTL